MFTNPEIVTFAVYLLGGGSSHIDIEDVAVKASELSPGRFAWRKYPQQIDIFRIASSLSDALKPKNGAYVLKSSKDEWMLTEAGLKFAEARVSELEGVDLSRKRQSDQERRWEKGERARLLGESAFTKFSAGQEGEITVGEAEAFFRINDYVTGQAREKKVTRIVYTFGQDAELGAAVNALAARIR